MKKSLKAIIAPSILSSDFSKLKDECLSIQNDGADWFHIDVMDYNFVPNLTIGPPVIKALRKQVQGFFDCHCMIKEPYKWIEDFQKAGANQVTFHYEADVGESHETIINKIKKCGMNAAMAIKPKTPIDDKILSILDKNLLDMVLIMTVEPGFGGQKFMEDQMEKVKMLRKKYPQLNIQVDGGINCDNAEIAAKAGANIIVSGSGIYEHKDRKYAIKFMREQIAKYI